MKAIKFKDLPAEKVWEIFCEKGIVEGNYKELSSPEIAEILSRNTTFKEIKHAPPSWLYRLLKSQGIVSETFDKQTRSGVIQEVGHYVETFQKMARALEEVKETAEKALKDVEIF